MHALAQLGLRRDGSRAALGCGGHLLPHLGEEPEKPVRLRFLPPRAPHGSPPCPGRGSLQAGSPQDAAIRWRPGRRVPVCLQLLQQPRDRVHFPRGSPLNVDASVVWGVSQPRAAVTAHSRVFVTITMNSVPVSSGSPSSPSPSPSYLSVRICLHGHLKYWNPLLCGLL